MNAEAEYQRGPSLSSMYHLLRYRALDQLQGVNLVSKSADRLTGTEGSNPSPSSGESYKPPHRKPQRCVARVVRSVDRRCDVGLPTVWAARCLAMNGRRRLIGSFWHGSMANALAQAIGAQAAFPGRQVISLSGDGGFTMLMGDFLSLQLGLPVKVVVFTAIAAKFGLLSSVPNGRKPVDFCSSSRPL